MKKRIFALALSVVMLMMIIAACAGTKTNKIFDSAELQKTDRMTVNGIEIAEDVRIEVIDYLTKLCGNEEEISESSLNIALLESVSPMCIYSGDELIYTLNFDCYGIKESGEDRPPVKGITVNDKRYTVTDNAEGLPFDELSPTG